MCISSNLWVLHMNNVTLKNETICEADRNSSDRVDDVDNLIYVNVSNVVVVVVVKAIISWVGG